MCYLKMSIHILIYCVGQLYSVPLNHAEIYQFFSTDALRELHEKQPSNLITLIRVLLIQIQGYVTAVRPLAYIPTTRQPNKLRSDDVRKLSNCIVILTRVVAYLVELNASDEDAVNEILWTQTSAISVEYGALGEYNSACLVCHVMHSELSVTSMTYSCVICYVMLCIVCIGQ
jgi:hypothetical protein